MSTRQMNYYSSDNYREKILPKEAPSSEAIATRQAPEKSTENSISPIRGAIYRAVADLACWKVESLGEEIADICGYPAETFVKGTCAWESLIHPEDQQWVQQEKKLSAANTRLYLLDYRLIHASGEVRWVRDRSISITVRGDADGSVRTWIDGAIFDITDLTSNSLSPQSRCQFEVKSKPMEPSLQTSTQPIVNFLENIADAFFTLDREWRFTNLNLVTKQNLAKNREELIGRGIWEEFPELAGSIWEENFRRSASERIALDCEIYYPSACTWLEVRSYPTTEGLTIYVQNVTRRKQTQAALQERAAQRGETLTRLSALAAKIGMALAQGGALPDVLTLCTRAAVEHLDVVGARIWTFNANTSQLRLEATAGEQTPPEDACGENSIVNFIANNREQVSGHVRSVSGKLRAISIQPLPELPLRAISGGAALSGEGKASAPTPATPIERPHRMLDYFAGCPLVVEDRLVGVMALYSRQPLSEDESSILEWVTNSIAIAIDRSWARDALLKRREGLLFRMANQIRNSLDLNTILETAVHEIRNLLQIDRCHFLWYLPHPQTPSLMVTHEARNPELPSLLSDCPPEHVDFLAEKILNMQLVRVDDVEGISESSPEYALLTSLGITSQLLLPLETRAGQLGAVACSHCSGPRLWSDSEVELLQAVVNQLASAIDQAELYAQTHAAALAAQTQAQQLSEALHNLKHTQAQLVQSEKMSSLGQMVAGVAHEINNPVNFIYGNLTYANKYIQDILGLIALYQTHYSDPVPVIQERIEDIDLGFLIEDLPKILASMEMGADRIRQIVLSLRNFSRLDEAEKKSVDIHEGLDNTLLILHNRLKPKGKSAGIQIVKEYGDVPKVECYPGQLNQVFMNVLSNAIDALESKNDPRTIVIHTEVVSGEREPLSYQQAESYVEIRIRDNGPGMTEEVKRRLFDPFFTTKPVGKGTGLGLSISYQIVVEKHGGILKCFSELGEGSEFWISIPMRSR